MTEQKEIRIPFSDLNSMVIECECGTEICIDFARDEVSKSDWNSKPLSCPVCTRRIDDNLRLGFVSFIEWRNRVLQSKQKISLRLRNPAN